MRLAIRHTAVFAYDSPVRESQNELRICPTIDAHQTLLSYDIVTTPSSRSVTSTDYWRTRVDALGVRAPHERLEVVAEATVETRRRAFPDHAPDLASLDDGAFSDRTIEHRTPHGLVDVDDALTAEAEQLRADARTVLALVAVVNERVHDLALDELTVPSGAATEIWARQAGSRQDLAHVAVSLCRAAGVPARFVSGYSLPVDGDPDALEPVEVPMRAWFEAAVPEVGWLAFDPADGGPADEGHVTVGRGRDYDDVPAVRGVFSGAATLTMESHVEIRRLMAQQQQQQQQQQ